LKVTTERQENCIVQLTISVDERTEHDYLRRAARALSRNYRLPGFRPGKAPYSVVVRRLGIDTVHAQVVEQYGDRIFEEGLEESGLEPAAQASLEEITWDPLTLHLKVPVGPQVHLGDYRDMRIPWEESEISDEDLDEELLRLQKEQSEWRPDDRPAELGDQVVLDITGKVQDDIVLENTAREMILNADSPYPIPGFAEAVVGMKPGETREFDLTYPEDHYNAEIAGQEAHFEVRLNEIRVEVLPLLDDEFAMSVGDYDDLEDLKTQVRQSLQENAERNAEQAYEEKMWEALFETANIEYPQIYVDREVESIKQQFGQQLQSQGMDLDSYFQLTNSTEEAWATQMRPSAEDRLKHNLILAEVIKQETLQAEEEEIETQINELLESLGEQADEIRETLSSPMGKMRIAEDLMIQKALDKLKAIARGQEPTEEAESSLAEGEEEATEPETATETEVPAEPQEETAEVKEESVSPQAEEDQAEATAQAPAEAQEETPAMVTEAMDEVTEAPVEAEEVPTESEPAVAQTKEETAEAPASVETPVEAEEAESGPGADSLDETNAPE
jgi:trigger factor